MNDPMEGIYSIDNLESYPSVEDTFKNKSNKLICSFSGEQAIKEPLMWGYYCNGFKGIAIEVEAIEEEVKFMDYSDELVRPETDNIPELINTILTRKLSCWSHENEYRFLAEGSERKHVVGTIVAVIVGQPYRKGIQNPDVDSRHAQIKEYEKRVRSVINVAKGKNIRVKEAEFKNGEINFKPLPH
jgi:hypothetical protein